jgi:hypothetical protein
MKDKKKVKTQKKKKNPFASSLISLADKVKVHHPLHRPRLQTPHDRPRVLVEQPPGGGRAL